MPRTPFPDLPSTSIVIADCVGRGHVNAGIECHRALQQLYASTNGSEIEVPKVLALAIPGISNLALGLEIFLKMYHFQNTGKYTTGHDIAALATAFDPDVLQGLRRVYLSMRHHKEVESAATLKIAVGEKQDDFGAVWPEDAADFDIAASTLGRAYERWRYIYEELHAPLVASISFKPLIAMVYTLDFAIRNFRSTAFVSVGESAA